MTLSLRKRRVAGPMSGDRALLRPSRPRLVRVAGGLVCLGAAILVLPAAADIFKCTDRDGNVTYQNEKCPNGTKAGRVDIFDNNWTANRSEKEAEWQRNAANQRVVTGMPARWVRQALGEPGEIRETTTGGATELWVYSLPDRSVQVGMRDNEVLWSREAPPATAARAAAAATARKPAPAVSAAGLDAPRPADLPRSTEMSRVSDLPPDPELPGPATVSNAADAARGVLRGRNCKEVLAQLGKPDRQRELSAGDAGETDPATEYIYETAVAGSGVRTRILCANGKVEGVDRSSAR